MRRTVGFFLLSMLFFGTGCLDYAEKLVLNKNGSGSMSVRIAIDKEARQEAERFAREMAAGFGGAGGAGQQLKDPFAMLDEDRIRTRLKEKNSGAELKKFEQFDQGGDEVTEMEVAFSSQNDLTDLSDAMSKNSDPGEVPFTYNKGSDGLWHFSRGFDGSTSEFKVNDGAPPATSTAPPGMPNIPGMPPGMDPAGLAQMAPEEREKVLADMMKDLEKNMKNLQANMGDMEAKANQMKADAEESTKGRKIRFEVHFPGAIVESNATSVNGKVAVWEYDLADLQNDKMPDNFTASVKQ